MSEQEHPQAGPRPGEPARRRWRIALAVAAIVVVGGLAGIVASQVGQAREKGGFGWWQSAKTAEDAGKRAERRAKHLAVELDASPEQMTKIAEIAKDAATDIFPIRQKILEKRNEAVKLIGSDKIDRDTIEALRKEQVSNVDALTQRLSKGIADATEVLNPDQRRKFAEWIEKKHMKHGKHGRPHHKKEEKEKGED